MNFYSLKTSKRKKGFTLIELLVVIAIIALLSSVVMASLSTARMKARDAKRIADIKNIKLALELYFDASSTYPVPPSALVSSSGNWINQQINGEWVWFTDQLKPYISSSKIGDPINNWSLSFYYRTYQYSTGLDSQCKFTPNTEGETYLMLFGTETSTFDLPKFSINDDHTKERYCVRP